MRTLAEAPRVLVPVVGALQPLRYDGVDDGLEISRCAEHERVQTHLTLIFPR